MAKLIELFLKLDFKTAGWKTYVGLALCVAAFALKHFAQLSVDDFEKLLGVGVGLATIGKLLSDTRKPGEEAPKGNDPS